MSIEQTAWTLDVKERVAVATFRHPPRNLMTFADMTALESIVQKVADDESISVLGHHQ